MSEGEREKLATVFITFAHSPYVVEARNFNNNAFPALDSLAMLYNTHARRGEGGNSK